MDYVPNTESDLQEMIQAAGFKNFLNIIESIPEPIRFPKLNLPPALSEMELLREMKKMGARNVSADQSDCFLGAGAYEHFIPTVVDYLAGRGEFYTAYTPYQAEASQGTLQAIYEFQSMMCALTGLEASNASLYDGSTAVAECVYLSVNLQPGRNRILVSELVHPEYTQTIRTYASGIGAEIVMVPHQGGVTDMDSLLSKCDNHTAAVFVQSPNFFGNLEDMPRVRKISASTGSLFVAVVNPISLGIVQCPGEYGADIAIGEGQPLGNHISYGGPYLGFMVSSKSLVHKIPGRIVGKTIDMSGASGFCLTLQAREQHIRREKATSNICTNQSLMALRATIYLSVLGQKGVQQVAELNVQQSHFTAKMLAEVPGYSLAFQKPFFNEFVLKTPRPAKEVVSALAQKNIFAGLALDQFYPELTHHLLVCVTETKSDSQIESFVNALKSII